MKLSSCSLFLSLDRARPSPSWPRSLAAFRRPGYLSHREAAQVARLLELPAVPADAVGRRRLIHRLGPLWPTAALLLGRRQGPASLRELAVLGEREGEALVAPPRLLSGEEAQEILGLPPGPEIGRALAAVEEAQIDGRVTNRDEAVAALAAGAIFRRGRPAP